MKRVVVFTLFFIFTIGVEAKVYGINNTDTASDAGRKSANKLMSDETNKIINLIDGSLGNAVRQRYSNSLQKYLLARQIKEIKKKKYLIKSEEIQELNKLVRLQCLYINEKVAQIDRKIDSLLVRFAVFMRKTKLFSLSDIYFFTNMYAIFLSRELK